MYIYIYIHRCKISIYLYIYMYNIIYMQIYIYISIYIYCFYHFDLVEGFKPTISVESGQHRRHPVGSKGRKTRSIEIN